MSGGHFGYDQYRIKDIADKIKLILHETGKPDGYGGIKYPFLVETLREFRVAIMILEGAEVYAHRIDLLVSGDDSEETFHDQLAEDLLKLKEET